MEVKDFWSFIDSIDIDARDDGRYTNEEIYQIGCNFISLTNSEKRQIGGWDKIAEIVKLRDKNDSIVTSGEKLRLWVKNLRYANDEVVHNNHMLSGKTINDMDFVDFEDKVETIKQDLYKQQVKTRDTMNSYRRVLREEARLEDFKDLMKELVVDVNELPEVHYDGIEDTNTEAVLLLSDLHIGIQIDNYYNKYNSMIARKRVDKLVQDTIRYCQNNHVQTLHVLGLGDFVQGIIHTNARLECEMDVVEQIMMASEILADALNKLQAAAPEVTYSGVTDNHSRVIANLHESIEAENFGHLITFYLKARLKDTDIQFLDTNLDQEIGILELHNGKTAVFAHGHHDNIASMFQNMTAYVGKVVDYAFVGHYHCEKLKTFQSFKVFVNGSICGMDQYAFSKRLFSKPSQTLLIFDGDNIINHSINLDINE